MNKPVFNPVLPSWEYVPDVEPRVFGDRLYLYGSHDRFGGDGGYCVELAPDMLTVLTESALVVPGEAVSAGTGFEGHAFYEASSPRKIGDRYYFIYFSERSHDLCYAVSDRPDSGYTYGGILASIGDIGLLSAPMIKCKKTPGKKCSFVAERKKIDS